VLNDLYSTHLYESYWLRCRTGNGAGNEIRTRDPDLGKVVLYQLSYSRIFKGAYSTAQAFEVKILYGFS
jgi:hypothetical protein